MSHTRLIGYALTVLALAACSKGTAPTDTPATPAAAVKPAVAEGAPQIVTTPDNVHLEYRVYGSGEPAVVLVHCWACDANYWNAQIDPLKSRYTVVALNLAGHGASEKNRTEWTIANYAEDVATVARQIPNRQIVLVGHSMGADVALEAAHRVGDRVIGIIAVDSLKSIGLPPMPQSEIDKMLAPFRTDFVGETRKYVAASLFNKGANPVFVQKVAYDMALEPQEVAIPSLQSLLSLDFATVLPGIHVPVYAINSDLTPTDVKRIRKSLPNFQVDVLDHTGHFLMMEVPQRFNPILLKDIEALRKQADG